MQMENLQVFKVQFDEFLQDKKKIKAIKNMSSVKGIPMHRRKIFDLISSCTKIKFLNDYERVFLSGLLNEFKIDYLDWCYKTPWLKQQIREMKQAAREKRQSQQLYFNLDKKDTRTIEVPVHILNKNGYTSRVTV